MKTVSYRIILPVVAFSAALSLQANAAVLDPGLSIVGSIVSDTGSLEPGDTFSESLYSTVGGVTSGAPVTNVSLTDTGDGYGHQASQSGIYEGGTSTSAADYYFTVGNATADEYEFTFGITYDLSADANSGADDTGDLDARSRSNLQVGTSADDNMFLDLELESESGDDYALNNPTWQDRVDGVYQGTNGAKLEADGTTFFTIALLGGTTMDLVAEYVMRGRVFDTGASYASTSAMFIFLDSFENLGNPPPMPAVPIPAGIWLFGTALVGLAGFRRRKRATEA